jgi:hypothetical protein
MREHHCGLVWALGVLVGLAGCGGSPASDGHSEGGSGGGSAADGATNGSGGAAGGSAVLSGSAGGAGSGVAVSTGGATGGAAGSLGSTAGGTGSGGAAGGKGGAAGKGGSGVAGAAGGGVGGGCKLPATVSFQKDVQTFLGPTCGGGNGCHVIDSASTTASGGYDHAYDWITAGAHPSSCPEKPTPKRFEIVMAVIASADPGSCSKSRQMPPPNETGANLRTPLTICDVATLQAWLDEPLVTQAHRVDDTDPAGTAPFPMPPFN